jgi:hypothetical protein
MNALPPGRQLASGAAELLAVARNVNSQSGEDGIIEAILDRLGISTGWCVEFGAWDGRHLSNTRALIDGKNFNAVMIEANGKSFEVLKRAFEGQPQVHCLKRFVGFGPEDNLDTFLRETPCPLNFDVLSIDIDGNDIHVWAAMERYRPKLVCIEFNPTIPTPVHFVQRPDPTCKQGASLAALFKLGQKKDYRLICANSLNGFFVASEYWSGDYAGSIAELGAFRASEPDPVYLFSGYDGSVLMSSEGDLSWHGLKVKQEDVQILPSWLRRYPDDYSKLQRLAFRFLHWLKGRRA